MVLICICVWLPDGLVTCSGCAQPNDHWLSNTEMHSTGSVLIKTRQDVSVCSDAIFRNLCLCLYLSCTSSLLPLTVSQTLLLPLDLPIPSICYTSSLTPFNIQYLQFCSQTFSLSGFFKAKFKNKSGLIPFLGAERLTKGEKIHHFLELASK